FKIGNHAGTGLFSDGGSIGYMIVMSVRHKDVVRLYFFDIHRFCEWVLSNKWVKEQVFPIDFRGKAGVAVVNNFHPILFCFFETESSLCSPQTTLIWASADVVRIGRDPTLG